MIYVIFAFITTKVVYDRLFARYEPKTFARPANAKALSFVSGKNILRAYLSETGCKNGGLVVIACGYRSVCSDYEAVIEGFREHGHGVFIFDCTGAGESGGNGSVGFAQEIIDLDCALSFIENNGLFGYTDVFLFGHSRGGLAVCCMEKLGHKVSAVVSVNGINSSMEGVMLPAARRIGNIAYVNYPMLRIYQDIIFGSEIMSLCASRLLSKTRIPTLIVHSADDEVVPEHRFSIISHKDEIRSEKVKFSFRFKGTSDGSHKGVLTNYEGRANEDLLELADSFFKSATTQKTN